MDRMKKFHERLKIFAIVGLLIITPLVSTTQSQRSSKYHLMIHFILNILIIAVGADAGLLSFFLHSPPPVPTPTPTPTTFHKTTHHQQQDDSMEITKGDEEEEEEEDSDAHPPQSDNGAAGDHHKSEDKSPPSDHHPTIFFIQEPADYVAQHQQHIDNIYGEDKAAAEEEEADNGDSISDQELYHKAETFIGNFYKQLKMQREHSRNKLHSHATFSHS